MNESDVGTSVMDLLRVTGPLGLLIVGSVVLSALCGILSILLKKRWYALILGAGIVSTSVLGFIARWLSVAKANAEIVAVAGLANSGVAAKVLSEADFGPLMASYGCVLLSALLVLGAVLIKRGTGATPLVASLVSLLCFLSLSVGTDQLIALNDEIDSSGGVRSFASEETDGAEEFSEPRLLAESSGQLAPFSGTLQPRFERALLYRGLGKWGLLGVVLLLLISLRSKRGAAAADSEA